MKYVYLFLIVAFVGALGAAFTARWLGARAATIIGALLTLAAFILFYINKSGSVTDTLIEKIAYASPPLITFSLVIGWWIGQGLSSGFARWRRLK